MKARKFQLTIRKGSHTGVLTTISNLAKLASLKDQFENVEIAGTEIKKSLAKQDFKVTLIIEPIKPAGDIVPLNINQ